LNSVYLVLIAATDYNFLGNSKRIACSYAHLAQTTAVGKKILMADGVISGTVQSINGGIVTIKLDSDGKIGQKKNMCLPGCPITLHTITELDMIDIVDFGLKYKVDQIAVSFTRRAKDLIELRRMVTQKDPIHGPNIQLIAKI
jgi:pyruvate kinase